MHHSTIAQRAYDAVGAITLVSTTNLVNCSLLDHKCNHQILTTTRVVDDTAYSSTSAPCWMQSREPPWWMDTNFLQ